MNNEDRAPRNRTLTISQEEIEKYSKELITDINDDTSIENKIICGDSTNLITKIKSKSTDLLFLDPPYNLTKKFGTESFKEMSLDDYEIWFESWFINLLPLLKETASIYVCGDWKSSSPIQRILNKYVLVRNRITWEREKGRGAKTNWKNSSEDIWFATVSNNYYFNVDAVKLKRKVLAPYKVDDEPKDWEESKDGNFRLTHPSNLWTDLTVPFWSMPENTDHPTQKPEKLLAKIILASSRENDLILDPFLGSGTSAVVASKLKRKFTVIEIDQKYACIALKRLEASKENNTIQGYDGSIFLDRNMMKK